MTGALSGRPGPFRLRESEAIHGCRGPRIVSGINTSFNEEDIERYITLFDARRKCTSSQATTDDDVICLRWCHVQRDLSFEQPLV